ncbi:MAG: toprim domain-containing protein, partial [Ktedonobacteraceae bacterium]|nr:toprim domain-containing protein [Ktedonobacteraceae bacterium]
MAVQECFHNGRTIYIISENDLQHVKKAGRRIRAQCPVHHSRDRDLSVAPYYDGMTDEDHHLAGWGYCHSAKCQATVLVREWNPGAAAAMLREPVQPIKPRLTLSSEELERADVWQERELLALEKLYPRMQAQLQHPRVQAYLAGRGLAAMGDLLESLGAGYIPPIGDRWNGWIEVQDAKGKARVSLAKWCDRLVFPHTARDGSRHFIGRTLHLWEPGMDENEHKRLLDELEQQAKEEYGEARGSRYAIKRYEKTYKSGFLHAAAMQAHQRILICEGVFDLLPLLYEGLENAVAISGTHIDVQAIPVHVRSCTLAFDADLKNGAAIASTCEKLGYAGITFDFLSPPDDQRGKDWSERYRLHGRGGLEPLLATAQQIAVAQGDEEVCVVCGRALIEGDVAHEIEFYYDADGTLYCAEHWPGHDRTDTQTDQDSQEASPVSSSLPGSGRLDRNTQGVIPVDGEFPAGANDSSAASANSESAPFPVATTAQMHDQALDDPVVQELMRAFGPLAKEGGIRTSDVYPA